MDLIRVQRSAKTPVQQFRLNDIAFASLPSAEASQGGPIPLRELEGCPARETRRCIAAIQPGGTVPGDLLQVEVRVATTPDVRMYVLDYFCVAYQPVLVEACVKLGQILLRRVPLQ